MKQRISYNTIQAFRRQKELEARSGKRRPGRGVLWRLLNISRPYWWLLASILLATTLTSAITLLYPALVGKIIDAVIIEKNTAALHAILILFIGLVFAQALLSMWQNYWSSAIGERIVIDLRIKLYSHIQQLPLGFFQDHHTGELLSRLTNDVALVRAALTNNLITAVQSVITLLAGITLLLIGPDALLSQASQLGLHLPTSQANTILNPFTLWMVILVPLFALPYIISGRFLRRRQKEQLEILSEATTASEEAIGNAKIVKAFTREEYEITRYTTLAQQQYSVAKKLARTLGITNGVGGLLGFCGLAAFIWLASSAVAHGAISAGNLTMTVIYVFILVQPVTSASNLYSQFQLALGAAERIFELLDQPITVTDLPGAQPLAPVEGLLRFERVTFGYDEQTPVLHDLSFEAPAGRVLALVGPSGAGKTTIANLIPRFFDLQQGCISIDGIDISQVQIKSLREQIGIVLQEPVLFGLTVRENIAYGRLEATQAEIEEVAKAANAQEFIERLPQGYETLVGEHGVKLSVGQRQRIAIARALLRNPRILILDEATSSLDNESESLVQEALDHLMQGRTTIVIAHRLSTIEHADKIIVINDGRIIEEGTHDELCALGGLYYRLATRSFQHEPAP